MSFKRWLPLLGALGLMVMVVGVAEATNNNKSKTRTLTRACFWVESKGDRVTYHDVKISRLNRERHSLLHRRQDRGEGQVHSRHRRARSAPLVLRASRASVARIGLAGHPGR